MSLAETSKNAQTEKKHMLPLIVTIEDPNTGHTVTFKPNFFVGLYTRRDGVPKESVGVSQIVKGSANILEQFAIVKAMKEKVMPRMLSQIDEKTNNLIEELFAAMFPDD